jgi:hypothetical protein
MRIRMQGLAAGAAFTLYAAMGAAAFAQPTPGMASGPGPQHHTITAHREDSAEHVARLRDLLQLRPAQEPALQAFVTALKSAHQGMPSPGGPMPSTTPERLVRMQQMMAQHQKTMSAVIDATRRFYDQLDPGQKRAFDAIPMKKMMMMHHHGMMGGPGMMGGSDDDDHPDMPPPPPRP